MPRSPHRQHGCLRVRGPESDAWLQCLAPVEETVATSRIIGKELNSNGFWMNSEVIRISTEKLIDRASRKSSSQGGIGNIMTTRIRMKPSAMAISPRFMADRTRDWIPAIFRPPALWGPCDPSYPAGVMSRPSAMLTSCYPMLRDPGNASLVLIWGCTGRFVIISPDHCQVVGHGKAFVGILTKLVAQCADRNAQNVCRMGAVAKAMFQAYR